MKMKNVLKKLSMLTALVLAFGLLAGCGEKDAKSYRMTGETLMEQTGAESSYRCGELLLNEDGSVALNVSSRSVDSDEKTPMYAWSGGTWTKNSDGTVSISLDTFPDGGGHEVYDGGAGEVETQVSLEEGELTASTENGKLTAEFTIHVELITYAMDQYTTVKVVAE